MFFEFKQTMGYTFLLQLVVLGVLAISGIECQEFVALNPLPRAPFTFHPAEELSVDFSEIRPHLIYASQNDHINQNLPQRVPISNPPKISHQQANRARPRAIEASSHHSQRRLKPSNSPPLTYGFQPKLPSNRAVHSRQRPKKFHSDYQKNIQSERVKGRQEPVYKQGIGLENQRHSSHFSENIQVQASVQQRLQNVKSHSDNFQNNPFNYHIQQLGRPGKFVPQTTEYRRPNNNFEITQKERKRPTPTLRPGYHRSQVTGRQRQEVVRKHETFEDAVQTSKNRNTHIRGNISPHKLQSNRKRILDQNKQHNDERLNLQAHTRSMQGGNKPKLPPRPPFNKGGIRINADELPVFHLDSIGTINENPTIFIQNENHHGQRSVDQDKKTYLLIKAPHLEVTESPTSEPFVVENLQHVSPSYILSNLDETTIHIPEIHSTPPVSEENVNAPAIVLDLVQIPEYPIFNDKKTTGQPMPNSEFRPPEDEDHDFVEHLQPTENYPTTPLRSYNDAIYQNSDSYSPYPRETPKHENKIISKPKVKESKKPANISYQQPISYSSSVSVVSVDQNTGTKQLAVRRQKTTLKKALVPKRKLKVPENDDYVNDDHYGSQDVPGDPGVDYPIYKEIPNTSFDCRKNKSPGFYADLEAGCQVFHNCDTGMVKHSFMCPNGTIFHQELFICDWWYNVRCEDSTEFYSLNSGLFIPNDDSEQKA